MIYCICRDLRPADCPGCQPVNDNNEIPEQEVVAEIFREVGEEREEYHPGCYEG